MSLRGLHAGRLSRAQLRLLACATAVLCGAAGAPAAAAVPDDSVGIYSEELERANSVNPVAAGHAQRGVGIGLVRQRVSWARIETSPGHLDFTVYDNVMAAAAIAGLSVLPVLQEPPPWRSTAPEVDPGPDMYPPRDPDAMAVLAGLLVQRYGPGGSFWTAYPQLTPAPIHSWQVWNEPNIPDFWATGPDPAAYARLLRAVGAAIHAADPTAEVVAAGMPASALGMPLADYLDGFYAAGARGTFDTLAIHPYARDADGVLAVLRGVRHQIDALGDSGRPIWATEFGWATDGPPSAFTTSEAAQAALLTDTIAQLRKARAALRLRGFVVFRWRDVALNQGQSDSWPLNTGLARKDGTAKPAFAAFRDAVAQWREPAPAGGDETPGLPGPAGPFSPSISGSSTAAAAIPGSPRRVLKIGRYVQDGWLYVRVAVPPGGGGRRVQIAYQARRGTRVVVRRRRSVLARKGVARAAFKLSRSARSASLLRITATQGDARATRDLRLRRARSSPAAAGRRPARPAPSSAGPLPRSGTSSSSRWAAAATAAPPA
jgi:hypothetical protein